MTERHVTFDIIVRAVCAVAGLPRHELMRGTRDEHHIRARFAAWWLATKLTTLSLSTIGRLSEGRDHTSILRGVARCDELRAGSEAYRVETDALLATLSALERHGLLNLARELDPLATARRVLDAPEREAVRVSVYEIVAMATLIVAQSEPGDPDTDPSATAIPAPIEEIDHAA